jgi:hypothetical protein
MQAVFGYDNDNGASPLYDYPRGANVIQYFSQLESIPDSTYYDKYVRINIDGIWEASEAYFFDKSDLVESFVKNDHLGFTIIYNHKGVIRKFYPDFMLRLANGDYMVIETKGVDSQQNQTKREYLNEWIKAVNNHGGFGKWHWNVSFHPSDIEGLVKKCMEKELA